METWVENVHQKAKMIHGQISAYMQQLERPEIVAGLEQRGISPEKVLQSWYDQLNDLYANEYPIAKLKDRSDLLIRAIGVNADHNTPMLKTVSKLAEDMKLNLGFLSKSVSPMMQKLSARQISGLPWVFNGYAPGSIMMGFSLKEPDQNSLTYDFDEEFYKTLSNTAQNIAFVPKFVEEDKINDALAEIVTDPAMRDVVLVAAHKISPTSQSGLHTIEVGSRTGGYGELTQKSRMVLAEEIKRPHLIKKHKGSFTGVLESADLGKERAVLRNIVEQDIGAIRCFVPIELSNQVKDGFGEMVRITGEYETDQTGKPRMFNVHSITRVQKPQGNLSI